MAHYPVVTICGSMRYYSEMIHAAEYLTRSGCIVLMPFVTDYVNSAEADDIKKMLDNMHFSKILLSEAIYVVGEHRGESTVKEIEFAKDRGVEVRYW